jgi:hypothetical protein
MKPDSQYSALRREEYPTATFEMFVQASHNRAETIKE